MNCLEDGGNDPGAKTLIRLFSSLPQLNQSVIKFLLDHLVKCVIFMTTNWVQKCIVLFFLIYRVNSKETQNKMSLHNLATVFGPTLLRPAPSTSSSENIDQLAMGTIDVMAQAGILYFFLLRRARGVAIQSSDS